MRFRCYKYRAVEKIYKAGNYQGFLDILKKVNLSRSQIIYSTYDVGLVSDSRYFLTIEGNFKYLCFEFFVFNASVHG